jgi:phosphoglycerol transferase MdoB-like AlkP superfamily enzyme
MWNMRKEKFMQKAKWVTNAQIAVSTGTSGNSSIPDYDHLALLGSGANYMGFSLPRFFAKEGVPSYAYHNNTMSYYDRHITHPNLGYIFKASKLGECSEAEYGQYIFPMENPGRWPSSDYEMMVGTTPEYMNLDRFHVYYMTVSGHMYYSFSGNSMSSRNKEAVKHLEMSENARAYYACHIELDKALEYLLEQLEAAGKLENTVICLSADHYPYAMTEEEYEELAGKDLEQNMDKFRNTLILWNAGIEEPIIVDKACCSIDIIPTLLNLFGLEFDSRMYAGRDIFSTEEEMALIKQAEQSDIGIVAIKTLNSGKIQNIPLAFGFLRQYESLVSVWGAKNIDDITKLLYFESNPPKVDEQFKIELEELRNQI